MKTQMGFSLVEVMVAFFILAGGLMALSKFQSNLVATKSISNQRAEATIIADEILSSIRNQATSTVAANPSITLDALRTNLATYVTDADNVPSTITRNTATYNIVKTSNVMIKPIAAGTAYIPIEVKITWDDRQKVKTDAGENQKESVILTSYTSTALRVCITADCT